MTLWKIDKKETDWKQDDNEGEFLSNASYKVVLKAGWKTT
jgi:hypothetical protein